MDKESLKKSVTLNLRCVTQSCKGGVPLNSLQNDYKSLIGTSIPFKELGFNSLELFLQSVPDTVCLKRKDGQVVVEGVADASTAHIADLISRQKSSKTTKKSFSKKPSLPIRKYSCRESWKSPPINTGGASKQNYKTPVSHAANPKTPLLKTPNSIFVSSTAKPEVSQKQNHVISVQSNVNHTREPPKAEQFWRTSSINASVQLPSNSYQTQTETLQKSTQLSLEIDEVSSEHSSLPNLTDSALTKSQRKSRRKKVNKAEKLLKTVTPVPEASLTKRQKKKIKAENLRETIEAYLRVVTENRQSSTLLNKHQIPNPSTSADKLNSLSTEKKQLRELTLKNLRSVILNWKGGVLLNNLQKDYESLFRTPIPYIDLGYDTFESFIQGIPDVICLKKNQGQVYAHDASDTLAAPISNLVYGQKQSENTKYACKTTPSATMTKPPIAVKIPKQTLPSFFEIPAPKPVLRNEFPLSDISDHKIPLNCFPRIKYSIASAEFNSLLLLNFLLFGNDSYMETLKRGILAFDGFSFCEGSERWKQTELLLSMLPEDTLKECLKLLCIEYGSDNKETLLHKVMQFLASPSKPVSNTVVKENTEDIIRKGRINENVEATCLNSTQNDVLKNLKQLQNHIHNLESITFAEGCATPSKPVNDSAFTENVDVCQLKNLQVDVSSVKVVKKKTSYQIPHINSKENVSAESQQFQKLRNAFSLSPHKKVLEGSPSMSVATGSSNCKLNPSNYLPYSEIIKNTQKKKTKQKKAAEKAKTPST